MSIINERIANAYTNQGLFIPGSWYEDSRTLFPPEIAALAWQQLSDSDIRILPPADQDLLVVSPAAGMAEQEQEIWEQEVLRRSGAVQFLVGDIQEEAVVGVQNQVRPTGDFTRFVWNADQLPVRPGVVDVIWERKAWLWHSAIDFDRIKIWETLHQYYDLLKTGGSIVMDAMDGFKLYHEHVLQSTDFSVKMAQHYAEKKKFRPSELFPNAPGQYESSTANVLEEAFPPIWKFLEEDFEIRDIGSSLLKVKTLTKK